MKFRILTHDRGRWGEGWQFGDIVDIDHEAARVPLENREIELFTKVEAVALIEELDEVKSLAVEENGKPEPTFECGVCGKICASPLGLSAHKRSHK